MPRPHAYMGYYSVTDHEIEVITDCIESVGTSDIYSLNVDILCAVTFAIRSFDAVNRLFRAYGLVPSYMKCFIILDEHITYGYLYKDNEEAFDAMLQENE